MGLFNFIKSGPQMEHIKMAYIGRYIYTKIVNKELKDNIYWHVNEQANYFLDSTDNKFDRRYLENLYMRTQYTLIALGMAELGLDHGLRNFQWTYIKRPQFVEYYEDNLWYLVIDSLKKRSGINVEFIPKEKKGDEVIMPS